MTTYAPPFTNVADLTNALRTCGYALLRPRDVCALAGCTLDDVCKTTVWLQDARDFGSFNRVYMSYFGDKKPARSTTEARLMVDARVEIDVVAYKPRG